MQLNTIGRMTQRLQKAPAAIEQCIERLGIQPTLVLNGLSYYSVEDESNIDAALRQAEAERILGRPIQPEAKPESPAVFQGPSGGVP
jgi:hypothetical protein